MVPTATVDPNWLMSTAAQSAAAIVAIVGGFLVSRLVTANSEKAALRRRLQETGLRVSNATSELSEVEKSLIRFDANEIVEDHLQFILEQNGQVSANELFQQAVRTEWKEQELEPYVTTLLTTYAEAFEFFLRQDKSTLNRPWGTVKARLKLGGKSEETDVILQLVYEELSYREKRANRHPGPYGISVPDFPPSLMARNTEGPNIRRELSQRRASCQSRIAEASAEAKYLRQAIEELPKSKDLWGGLAVLGIFSVSGVLVPLYFLATQTDSPLTMYRKVVVIGGFVFGFAVLAGYLVRQNSESRQERGRLAGRTIGPA